MTIGTIDEIMSRLEAAALSRSPFSFLQLATVDRGGAPQLRTIVLRGCDRAAVTLSFVTDRRSAKIAEMQSDPRVALIGYDPSALVQLRLSGVATIVADDEKRRSFWAGLRETTRGLFDTELVPGSMLDDQGRPADPKADGQNLDTPFERFALVTVELVRLEWLDLAAEPHLRYAFQRVDNCDNGDNDWRGSRLAP